MDHLQSRRTERKSILRPTKREIERAFGLVLCSEGVANLMGRGASRLITVKIFANRK